MNGKAQAKLMLGGWLLVLVLVLFAWRLTSSGRKVPDQSVARQDAAVTRALASASPQSVTIIASNFALPPQRIFYSAPSKPPVAPAGPPRALEDTNVPPDVALDNLRHTIRDYASMFGGNPVGLNSEITAQLSGKNPKQANFIRPDAGMRINDRGELVDPWGTPYFFHQLSGTEMEIHSAGPDKIMWTADDLVTK